SSRPTSRAPPRWSPMGRCRACFAPWQACPRCGRRPERTAAGKASPKCAARRFPYNPRRIDSPFVRHPTEAGAGMYKNTLVALAAAACATGAAAQDTKVAIGISGWTGFAPLTLAKEAGLFKKYGLDVDIKKIPQKDRHLAIASGDVQCAATTVETWVVWNANGVATTQIFQLDKSYGADGMVVKPSVSKIGHLQGKPVAASAPGTSPYFALAWMLKKNGMSTKDVKVVNLEPQAAANAMIAGRTASAAAMTEQ